ncbi:MAG: hypothetical protein RLY43_151, partial [Bacteroidota bacterium]
MKSKLTASILTSIFIFSPILLLAQTSTTTFKYGTQYSSTNTCVKLERNLYFGISGTDVTSLQNFLKSKGHLTANATGYFGSLTQEAVAKFQKAEGIVLNGTPE